MIARSKFFLSEPARAQNLKKMEGSSPPEAQKTEAVSIEFSGAYNTTFNPFIFFTKKAID